MTPEDWQVVAVVTAMTCGLWVLFVDELEKGAAVVMRWPSTGHDRMLTGEPYGGLLEVFDPPWWKLHRWAWWLTFARRRGRAETLLLVQERTLVVRCTHARVGVPAKRFRGRRLG